MTNSENETNPPRDIECDKCGRAVAYGQVRWFDIGAIVVCAKCDEDYNNSYIEPTSAD